MSTPRSFPDTQSPSVDAVALWSHVSQLLMHAINALCWAALHDGPRLQNVTPDACFTPSTTQPANTVSTLVFLHPEQALAHERKWLHLVSLCWTLLVHFDIHNGSLIEPR